MNLRVLRPDKWKVVLLALNVPKRYIRRITLKDIDTYTVPLQFVMDNKINYFSCSKHMTVKSMKETVSELRGVDLNQVIFVCRGALLDDMSPIPDNVIFCIICQKGGLTDNQMHLLSTMAVKQVSQNTKASLQKPKELRASN